MSAFFVELGIVMLITFGISLIVSKIKQPLLIGYIITGIISGPLFLNILSSTDGYQTFSHFGVALLLFIVGLHLNLKLIKEIGFVAFVSGSFQIILTALFGFLISFIFGLDIFTSFLFAIGLSFSSTIVIIKLLTDRRDIDKVYGKIVTGILIVQDLVAVIMLMILSSISNADGSNLTLEIIKTFARGIVALGGVLIFSKLILEKVLDNIAQSQELLYLFVISWCLGIAILFSYLGFSIEVGALLAGIALASSPYQYEISSRVKPLRDFFIVMFFILLGSQMIPLDESIVGDKWNFIIDSFSPILFPALIFSIFVLIGKPLVIFLIMNILGFHSKVAFQSAVSLGQISEFSLIIILMAYSQGMISSQIVSMLTLVAIISIAVSTYMIAHSDKIYNSMSKFLHFLEIRKPKRDTEKEIARKHEVLVFGYDRIGFSLLKSIEKLEKNYIVVDYNPEVIKKLKAKCLSCIYGDANDIDFLEEFDFETVQLLISTIPDVETNMLLLKEFKKVNNEGTVILTADKIDNALDLYNGGADYVILPHFLGGNYVSTLIENYSDNFQNFLKEKVNHINELKERKSYGLEHPKGGRK